MHTYSCSLAQVLTQYLLIALPLSLLSGCGGLRSPMVTPAPTLLRIGGSSEMLPLLAELSAGYNATHPNVILDLQASDTRVGQESLQEGRLDLAASSWYHPTGKETPDPLVGVPIAWDGLAILVQRNNKLNALTLNQLQSLYDGRTLTWDGVGGAKEDIVLISREDGSGSRDDFEAVVMKDHHTSLTALVMPSAQAMVDYVGTHPNALGYASMGLVTDTVKLLSIEGQKPTSDTVRDKQYALSRLFYLLSKGTPTGVVADFIGFAVSPAGQAIVGRRYGRVR